MTKLSDIKIISGGQTGVDRAALDFALANQIACGGWCPKGRKAEDGKIPEKYPLFETLTSNYPERTNNNIKNSDGSLIFYSKKFDPGTGLTLKLCQQFSKPHLVIKLDDQVTPDLLIYWIKQEDIKTLNIAGPRESCEPGIYQLVLAYLDEFRKRME